MLKYIIGFFGVNFFLEYFHVSHETTFCEKKPLIYLSKNTSESEH